MKEVVRCPICEAEHSTQDYYGTDLKCTRCDTRFVFDAGIYPVLTPEQKKLLITGGIVRAKSKA